jgi:hypothetical protein
MQTADSGAELAASIAGRMMTIPEREHVAARLPNIVTVGSLSAATAALAARAKP